MRSAIRPAILAILLIAPQIGARAESLREWSRRFDVKYITGMATFQRDPLRDKGSIIAVPAKFDRTVAEKVAVFRGGVLAGPGDNSPNAEIVISNVPAEQFTAGETLVVAFKIIGMHPQYGLPHGEFVGAYHCSSPGCRDFLR